MRSFCLLTILCLTLGIFSCSKGKTYPTTPEINVLAAEVVDTGIVKATIQFTDGDGDIGLSAGDTVAPYDSASGFYNNLLVNYYEMKSGVWTKVLPSGYRIQPITPAGKDKQLEGEIEIQLFYKTRKDLQPGETYFEEMKYDFQLIDRALNKSNVSETKGIIKK